MIRQRIRLVICLAATALLLSTICLSCRTGSETFDFRQPRSGDYPQERVSGTTSVQFPTATESGDFLYDVVVTVAADEVREFEIREVRFNDRPVEGFRVFNGSIVNFLCRANGMEDLKVQLYADWQPGQKAQVVLAGVDPKGKPISVSVAGETPAEKTYSNSVGFNYPTPELPYFHVRSSFNAANYDSFRIESITANGKPVREYRVFNDGMALPGKKDVPKGEVNDRMVSGDVGFSVAFPLRWEKDENVTVTVIGNTESGKAQELTASGKATWNGFWRPEWQYQASIVVHETVGIPRQGEPVEVTLGLMHYRITDPKREIRVVTNIPGHPDADDAGYVEVPSQVIDVIPWNDRKLIDADERDHDTNERIRRYVATTTVQLVFMADVEAYEERVFLICYGNPDAESPAYSTDLCVEGTGLAQTVSNDRYRMSLAGNSGAIETVTIKGDGPEVLLEHKLETNGAVHWNPGAYTPPLPWVHVSDWENPKATFHTGPVLHRANKYADLPFMKTVAAHVTYEFYAEQPYMLMSSTMEVKEDIFVQALRNGEVVFNHAVLDEFVWKDPLGKVQSVMIEGTKKHPIHALEIPPDTPWLAFISREAGVGFAGINVAYENVNLYGSPISQAQPYFYVQNGPWIYWSRPLVYPFGHLNFTRMMPVRKGSVYAETMGFLPFRFAKGSDPFAEIETCHRILTHPLQAREWIDLDPKTPDHWIMPLLTMPFDEAVEGAKSSREVPKE
ncbi:MAG: hypothetical protein ABIH23_21870 [bacterium]